MNTLTNVKKSQGIMMFIILLLSYKVFASNWVAGSNLSEKIVYHYFNGEQVSPMVSEVIYYTLTTEFPHAKSPNLPDLADAVMLPSPTPQQSSKLASKPLRHSRLTNHLPHSQHLAC